MEAELALAVNDSRFIPYLALHEFEALVYASLPQSASAFGDNPMILQTLLGHMQGSSSPEQINESPETAPSRRLLAAYPRYQKTFHGPMAVRSVALSQLRRTCPHFNDWVSRLERV